MANVEVSIHLANGHLTCLRENISETTSAYLAPKHAKAMWGEYVVTCDDDDSWSLLQVANKACSGGHPDPHSPTAGGPVP